MNIRIKKEITLVIMLFSCILVPSCQREQKETNFIAITPEKAIESWEDSIYLRVSYSLQASDSGLTIADYTGHRLLKLTNEFELDKIIGKNGRGPGEMINPASFVFQNSKYYVLDRGNKRINIYRNDGSYEKMIKLTGEVN
ncbi:MAG: hypothetical protein D6730_16295, partial [Bacteroidetes bacterium]